MLVRVGGVEPPFLPWEGSIIAVIRHPHENDTRDSVTKLGAIFQPMNTVVVEAVVMSNLVPKRVFNALVKNQLRHVRVAKLAV